MRHVTSPKTASRKDGFNRPAGEKHVPAKRYHAHHAPKRRRYVPQVGRIVTPLSVGEANPLEFGQVPQAAPVGRVSGVLRHWRAWLAIALGLAIPSSVQAQNGVMFGSGLGESAHGLAQGWQLLAVPEVIFMAMMIAMTVSVIALWKQRMLTADSEMESQWRVNLTRYGAWPLRLALAVLLFSEAFGIWNASAVDGAAFKTLSGAEHWAASHGYVTGVRVLEFVVATLLLFGAFLRLTILFLASVAFAGVFYFGSGYLSTFFFLFSGAILLAALDFVSLKRLVSSVGSGGMEGPDLHDVSREAVLGVRWMGTKEQAYRLARICFGAGLCCLGMYHVTAQEMWIAGAQGLDFEIAIPLVVIAQFAGVAEITAGILVISGTLLRVVMLAVMSIMTLSAITLAVSPFYYLHLYALCTLFLFVGGQLCVGQVQDEVESYEGVAGETIASETIAGETVHGKKLAVAGGDRR